MNLSKTRRYKDLLTYLGLSYLDKFLIFFIPLLIVSFFTREQLYNEIEYIYSIALLIHPVLDLGLSSYSYYGYRKSDDRISFMNKLLSCFFKIYVFFGIALLILLLLSLNTSLDHRISYTALRFLFLFATIFFITYFRLIDKPFYSLLITSGTSFLSLCIFAMAYFIGEEINLFLFFSAQIIACTTIFAIALFKTLSERDSAYIMPFLKKSISYYLPIAASTFLFMGIANYGKIYGLNHLSTGDLSYLAIVQRFSLLVQIAHSASLAFIMKKMFISTDTFNISIGLLKKYSFFLLLTSIGAIILMQTFALISPTFEFQLNAFIILIIGYTLIWCLLSFLESYFNKANLTIYKLIIAFLNAIIFLVILKMEIFEPLFNIAVAMFVSTFISFAVAIFFLKRKGFYLS